MCEKPPGDNLKHTQRSDNRMENKHSGSHWSFWGKFLMNSEVFLKLGEDFGDKFDFRSEETLIRKDINGGGIPEGLLSCRQSDSCLSI